MDQRLMKAQRGNQLKVSSTFRLVCLFILVWWASTPAHGQGGPPDNLLLNILGRWQLPSAAGFVTASLPFEPPGGTFQGQLFYVPALPSQGQHALYRLARSSPLDQMDSTSQDVQGYTGDGILGYPFSTHVLGTCRMERWTNRAQGNHLTSFCDEDPTQQGYVPDTSLGFGYPRYGTSGEEGLVVQGTEVKIIANKVAGGAISELWWNGKQFINDRDYGRQISIAFNLTRPIEINDPTEPGDRWGWPGAVPNAGWAHGSPLIAYSVSGHTLVTKTQPLQWKPETFGGGRYNPVMWKGTISKQVDLDFNQSPHVIRWITTVDFPRSYDFLDMEILTAYYTDEFKRFYAFDAAAQSLAEMTSLVPNGGCIDPSQDPRLRPLVGGVIIATDDGAYALGAYRRSTANLFGLCKWFGYGSTYGGRFDAAGGKYGFDTVKWNLLYRPAGGVTAGSHSFTLYLVVGTLAQVQVEMRTLYRGGF